MNKKLRIGLFFGGASSEHEISLISAASVLKHLNRDLFTVLPVGILKNAKWRLFDDAKLMADTETTIDLNHSSGRDVSVSEVVSQIDLAFPMLHGPLYEDGAIQGFFETMGVPYVGSGVLGSAVGMDKVTAKRLARGEQIATPAFIAFSESQWRSTTTQCRENVHAKLNLPVFVKPVCAGSSVGISKVTAWDSLDAAIEEALKFDIQVIVEQGVVAREIELAVLEETPLGSDLWVSLPGEVIPHPRHGFYSYESKYHDSEGATFEIPARLTSEQVEQAQQMAREIFRLLRCQGMARVDLFYVEAEEKFYFNEVNTLPGFTSISLYPRLMAVSGLPYSELLTKLVDVALAHGETRAQIERDWTD